MSRALVVLALTLTLTGCIKRYAAPEEAAPAEMPYSAVAAMQRIVPAAEEGPALPAAAIRLAIGPEGWFADDALLGGTLVVEGDELDEALSTLRETSGPIVVLLDAPLLREPAICEVLTVLGDRVIAAGGSLGYGPDKADLREAAEGLSRDPLGRVSVSCP